MKKYIIKIVVFSFLALSIPSVCKSECSPGNSCYWEYTGRTLFGGSSSDYNLCHDLSVSYNLVLPNCNNYADDSVVYVVTDLQQYYSQPNQQWGGCTWYLKEYRKKCGPTPTCFDRIQNQGETGVDCGGPCSPCCIPSAEICDYKDNDCDGLVDEGVMGIYYPDADGDGYGTGVSLQACSAPAGYAGANGDCKDDDASVHPGAVEIFGDGKNNDCFSKADCIDSAYSEDIRCYPPGASCGN